MDTMRWTNQGHPQTLQTAVFLLYFDAVFSLLGGSIIFAAIYAASGVGIANDKRLAYWAGVGVTGLAAFDIVRRLMDDFGLLFNFRFLLAIIFPIALFALLIHPMSRNYQRTWFTLPGNFPTGPQDR